MKAIALISLFLLIFPIASVAKKIDVGTQDPYHFFGENRKNSPYKKISYGMTNVATSGAELVREFNEEYEKDNNFASSFVVGVAQGFVNAVKRSWNGLKDIASYKVPGEANYEASQKPINIDKEVTKLLGLESSVSSDSGT